MSEELARKLKAARKKAGPFPVAGREAVGNPPPNAHKVGTGFPDPARSGALHDKRHARQDPGRVAEEAAKDESENWNLTLSVRVVRARIRTRIRPVGPADDPRGVRVIISRGAVKRLRGRCYNREIPGARKMGASALVLRHLERTLRDFDGKEAA